MKPREFWIDPTNELEKDEGCEIEETVYMALSSHPGQGPLLWQSNLIHVIEYSAYQALEAKLEILKSKQSQFESTLMETIRIRDLYIERHKKLLEALGLAEEVMTHPAVYSEAELRNESLKIRRDKFMEALQVIAEDEKASEK